MKDKEFKINEAEIDDLIKSYHANPADRKIKDRLNQIIIEQQDKFYKKQAEQSRAKEPSKTRGREM